MADRALSVATSLALTVDYQAVISCGPPHWAHSAARRIARRIDRPLVLDFRDPWSLIEGLPEDIASPLWFRRAELAETACVEEASLIVANTDRHREALSRRYPGAAERIITVFNGFDAGSIPEVAVSSDRFLIVYSGTLYWSRDPRPFLQAAGRVVRNLRLSPREFRIEFIGDSQNFRGVALSELAGKEGLEGHLATTGALPRPEALRRAATADLLLNLPQDAQLCIPAKIYEYLQMDGRILALEEPGSATEHLLRSEDADVVGPEDVGAIARIIEKRYREHDSGNRGSSAAPSPELSRSSQAERFARALEDQLELKRQKAV